MLRRSKNNTNQFNKKNDKNSSNKSIFIQTNVLNAVAKNKKEGRALENYTKRLDKKLADTFYQIEKDNYKSRIVLSELNSELKSNDYTLEDFSGNSYFNIMRTSMKIDPRNYFLPFLLKNLEQQEQMSSRKISDMIDYKLTNTSKSYIHDEKLSDNFEDLEFESTYTQSVNFYSESDFYMPQPQNQQNQNNFSEPYDKQNLQNPQIRQRCTTAYQAPKKPLIAERAKTSRPKLESVSFNNASASSFKSVRRDQRDPRLSNNIRDSKIYLLKHFKKNDYNTNAANVCSKRCLFN